MPRIVAATNPPGNPFSRKIHKLLATTPSPVDFDRGRSDGEGYSTDEDPDPREAVRRLSSTVRVLGEGGS
jgi:hypothetical protein